jgi:hypothetical protein
MASVDITKYRLFGVTKGHTRTTWEVYDKMESEDEPGTLLYKEEDSLNKLKLRCRLLNPDGTHYDPLRGFIVRAKFLVDDVYTDWTYFDKCANNCGFIYNLPGIFCKDD